MSNERLKRLIHKYSIISFDMFDTLVKREVFDPSIIFDIVQKKYNKEYKRDIRNYKEKRLNAYSTAYENLKAKCTLDDIYKEIDYSEEDKDGLKRTEIATEIDLCVPNLELMDVFEYAQSQNKRIVITTDMYLPIEVIETILQKCDIHGYEKIFLSCAWGVSKTDGRLYDVLLQTLKVTSKDILHIGDGLKNDFLRANMKGIATYHVRDIVKPSYNNSKGFSDEQKLIYKTQQKLICNHLLSTTRGAERIGFEEFGPLLYGFTKWLHDMFQKENINKVYFLAREGLLFKNVYEMLFPSSSIETHYLFVSRKSLISPTYWITPKYEDVMNSIAKSKSISISSQIKRWGLSIDESLVEINEAGYEPNTIIEGRKWSDNNNLKRLYNSLKEKIIKQSIEDYRLVKKYLQQENFGGKCAIVDIGWNGGMQNALQKIASIWESETEIQGYYMGINPKNLGTNIENAKGFIYDENHGEENRYFIFSFAGPFELTMTALHNSTIGYLEKNEMVIPQYGSGEYIRPDGSYTDELNYVEAAQKGIKKFIECYKKLELDYDSEVSFRNCREFGLNAKRNDIKIFTSFGANDLGESQHFVSEKYNGLFGDYSLIKGFWSSTWKAGYLKKIFRFPLPYYKLYVLMRKRIDR